jgi:DNA-binding transcriptional MocR family regulator
VIEDDHASIVAGAPMHTIAAARGRWATVRSVAKTYGPDLRLAVLAGDPTTVRRVDGRLRIGPGWVSHVLQRIAVRLMADQAVSDLVAAAADHYRRRRTTLIDRLAGERIDAHGASGLNVWVPVADEAAAVTGLRDRGIVVRPGARFRIRSGPGIRVTTASLADEQIEEVAAAITATLRPGRAATRSG